MPRNGNVMTLKHSIFWDYFISTRFGGPTGYLAHLRTGLDQLPVEKANKVEIFIDAVPENQFTPANKTAPTERDLYQHIRYFENPDNFELSENEFSRLMRRKPRSVHLHTSPLAYKVFRTFKKYGVTQIPIFLTSHTPESNGKEMADQYRVHGLDPSACQRLENAVRFIEALAFQSADVWIFPSVESMEPYYETIPSFQRWAKNKDIRFVPTGAALPRSSIKPELSKEKFGLSGRTEISFKCLHNEFIC